jgi:hypothetical protein
MQIGMSAWIVQDGNYPDFTVGQRTRFALEFYAESIRSSPAAIRSFAGVQPARYNASGIITYATEEAWVVDFGILAFSESKPPSIATVGASVSGEFSIGIDPFFYFERLCKIPGFPELRYDWRVDSILLETTPWLSTRDATGRKVLCRDDSRTSYREVDKTDAWHDDDGNGNYVLNCTRIETPR